MVRALSKIMWFFLFANPLWWSVWVVVSCFLIPWFSQNVLNLFDKNSLPRSLLSTLIFFSSAFFTICLKILNSVNAPLFAYRKNIQVFFEKSSVKVTKILDPPNDVWVNGPHKSEWINSFLVVTLLTFALGTYSLCCLPNMHSSQNCEMVGM
jgi:hypothetical protein